MRIEKDFEQIGTLNEGELVIKFPGTDLKMPYKSGRVFLNNVGVGYVALAIRDAYCEENGEARGLVGSLGRQLGELLRSPIMRSRLREFLLPRDLSLFYSQGQDGVEILCIPGVSGEDDIDDRSIPHMVVATYSTGREIPSAEKVYAHHMKAVGFRRLITDGSTLERELLQLVPKANWVYERALQIMEELGFP